MNPAMVSFTKYLKAYSFLSGILTSIFQVRPFTIENEDFLYKDFFFF